MEHSRTGRIVAIANQKGGVGKTTTTINLGASLGAHERRTLIVDVDPQGNATSGVGIAKNSVSPTTYDVIAGRASVEAAIRATEVPYLDLVPANRELVGAELELVSTENREFVLRELFAHLRQRYEFVLLDCPPSLGLLTLNALTAADSVLVPIQCEYFALEGVSELMDTIERVRGALNPALQIEGILLTMYDERTNLSRQVADDIRNYFKTKVFNVVIPRNIKLGEAPSHGKPVLAYDIKSRGAEAYLELAREVLAREAAA